MTRKYALEYMSARQTAHIVSPDATSFGPTGVARIDS